MKHEKLNFIKLFHWPPLCILHSLLHRSDDLRTMSFVHFLWVDLWKTQTIFAHFLWVDLQKTQSFTSPQHQTKKCNPCFCCFIYVHFWKRKLKPMIFQIQKHSLKTHHKSPGWIYKQAAMRRGGHNPTDIEVPKSNQNIIKCTLACITQWNLSKSGHHEYQQVFSSTAS